MATVPLMFAQEDVEFGGKPGIINDFAYNNNVMQAATNVRLGRCIYLFCYFHIFLWCKSVSTDENVFYGVLKLINPV